MAKRGVLPELSGLFSELFSPYGLLFDESSVIILLEAVASRRELLECFTPPGIRVASFYSFFLIYISLVYAEHILNSIDPRLFDMVSIIQYSC